MTTTTPLPGAGSTRRYFRQYDAATGASSILCRGSDIAENRAFVYLCRHFHALGLPVPRILDVADDEGSYTQTDLGDTSLYSLFADGNPEAPAMLEAAMRALAHFQFEGVRGLDTSRLYPHTAMDRQMVMRDLNLFTYCFVKPSGLDFNEETLAAEMEGLCREVMAAGPWQSLMLRDFQSRNVMVKDGAVWLIDFQNARLGAPQYDVVSMLWQPRLGLTDDERRQMLAAYLDEAARVGDIDEREFMERLPLFVLLRVLQVLGAYGFRGLIQHKSRFITPIPQALCTLREVAEDPEGVMARYPTLRAVSLRLAQLPQYAPAPADGLLRVRVSSFSYHKGIPEDLSGNGGGFVFDCRAIHNPGRYEPYKHLTGRDTAVIEFLETRTAVAEYLDAVYRLVEPAVATYLERGFTSLSISFGCTGGQHRSVYCAEHTAERLRRLFPRAVIILDHRELP